MSEIEITWAGGEDSFKLGLGELRALQQRCDAGPAWILTRLGTGQWMVDDVIHTIRLGLEGAGMEKDEARRKVDNYVTEKLANSVLTARLVLMAALYGSEDDPVGEVQGEAAPTAQTSPAESGSSPASTLTAPSSDSTPAT